MIVNDVFLVSFSDRLERVTLAWSVQVTIYDKWFVFLISGGSQNTNISVSEILCAQRLRTANTSVSATKYYILTFTIMQNRNSKIISGFLKLKYSIIPLTIALVLMFA